MPVTRSPELCLVGYFLSRYSEPGTTQGKLGPPEELGVSTWGAAYAQFYDALADGRTLVAFANSLKNARDNFDSHLATGRVGWRAPRGSEGGRPPQPLSTLEAHIAETWNNRTRAELWAQVAQLATGGARREYDEVWQEALDDPELREAVARRVRRGQTALRERLLKAYGYRCALTRDGPSNVLEAAHIRSHASTGLNRSTNAILLRADLHTLFDDGMILIHPRELTVTVDRSLRTTSYWSLRGRVLAPRADGLVPDPEALAERWRDRSAQGFDGPAVEQQQSEGLAWTVETDGPASRGG